VPDAIFAHPRLAAVYDAFDGERDDLPLYVAIADEVNAAAVLDLGCGAFEKLQTAPEENSSF